MGRPAKGVKSQLQPRAGGGPTFHRVSCVFFSQGHFCANGAMSYGIPNPEAFLTGLTRLGPQRVREPSAQVGGLVD